MDSIRDLGREILMEDPNHRLMLYHLEDLIRARLARREPGVLLDPHSSILLSSTSPMLSPTNGEHHADDGSAGIYVALPSLPDPILLHTFSHTLASLHPLTATDWTSRALVFLNTSPGQNPHPGSIAAAAHPAAATQTVAPNLFSPGDVSAVISGLRISSSSSSSSSSPLLKNASGASPSPNLNPPLCSPTSTKGGGEDLPRFLFEFEALSPSRGPSPAPLTPPKQQAEAKGMTGSKTLTTTLGFNSISLPHPHPNNPMSNNRQGHSSWTHQNAIGGTGRISLSSSAGVASPPSTSSILSSSPVNNIRDFFADSVPRAVSSCWEEPTSSSPPGTHTIFNSSVLSSSYPTLAHVGYRQMAGGQSQVDSHSPGKSDHGGGGTDELDSSLEAIIAFHSPGKINSANNMEGLPPKMPPQLQAQALAQKQAIPPPIASNGWAAIAATSNGHKPSLPPPSSSSSSSSPPTAVEAANAWKHHQQQLSSFSQAPVVLKAFDPNTRVSSHVSPRVQGEILRLCSSVPGLRLEDFDEGVLHQLSNKRSEEEALAALRSLSGCDVTMLQHPAAYLNHVIKGYHVSSIATPGVPQLSSVGANSHLAPHNRGKGHGRSTTTTVSSTNPAVAKQLLAKLPLRVFKRLEEVVNRSNNLDWKHFDAGVVKVLVQLSELGDEDVTEELELLSSTDLSAVEYMPAYLNKRLNNRLWSKRKLRQQQQGGLGAAGPPN